MDIIQWYATILGGLLAVLLILQLRQFAGTKTYAYIRFHFLKKMAYRLLLKRRYWASVTNIQALVFAGFIAANAAFMFPTSSSNLMRRAGMLASVNMVPLFLGGRTSLLANFLGVPLHVYLLAHHWIGRIVVVQGLLHAGLVILSPERRTSGLIVTLSLTVIFISSLCIVRWFAFEWFLKTHLLLALLTVGVLLWHLFPDGFINALFPTAALTFWLFNELAQRYRRHIRGRVEVDIKPIYAPLQDGLTSRVTAIKLTVRTRPWRVRPGQYFYFRFQNGPLAYRFQSHPFLVAWWDNKDKDSEDEDEERNKGKEDEGRGEVDEEEDTDEYKDTATRLTFLIQPQGGLSRLIHRISSSNVVMDGPYGKELQLGGYETVMLVADGIGITGILPYAQHLADRKRHDNWVKLKRTQYKKALNKEYANYLDKMARRYRGSKVDYKKSSKKMESIKGNIEALATKKLHRDLTRKVDVFWSLEENCQEQWLVQMWCRYPYEGGKPAFKPNDGWKCLYPSDGSLPDLFKQAIAEETKSPGKSIVVVCGTASFTKSIRNIVLDKIGRQNIIEFAEVEFRPWRSPPEPPLKDTSSDNIQTYPYDIQRYKNPVAEPRNTQDLSTRPRKLDKPGNIPSTHHMHSRFSVSEEELQIHGVKSQRPAIFKSKVKETPRLCVIGKSNDGMNENWVEMDVTDFV